MKIFYDRLSIKEIVDVSGLKTLEQIKAEFGEGDYEEAILQKGEGHRIAGDKIETYNIKDEADQAKAVKEAAKNSAKSKIKTKLGLNDNELEDLRIALG